MTSIFRPSISAELTKASSEYDAYGQPVPGESLPIYVAVVWLSQSSKRESVRRDASASQRNAGEQNADARILVSHLINVKNGDKIEVAGVMLQVNTVLPRIDLDGAVDHLQVDCSRWA